MRHYLLPEGNVQISFSGGRTSAFMLHQIAEANGGIPDRARVVFANTGREMPQTLDFVEECSYRWGISIVWVERAPGGGFAVKDHATAARDGQPFEDMIRSGGRNYLPNPTSRHCTSDLKVRPARDYLLSLGWERWTSALGIRADEAHRSAKPVRERWVHWRPMVHAGVTARDVGAFWSVQPFDLRLPNVNGNCWLGNCDGCFLKSEAHIAAFTREFPERAAWWEEMERVAEARSRTPSGARFRTEYSRAELRSFVERQGDWIFDTDGALCQASGGECFGDELEAAE